MILIEFSSTPFYLLHPPSSLQMTLRASSRTRWQPSAPSANRWRRFQQTARRSLHSPHWLKATHSLSSSQTVLPPVLWIPSPPHPQAITQLIISSGQKTRIGLFLLHLRYSWLRSYLSGWSIRVSWQGKEAISHRLSTGVPEGSALGSLLQTYRYHNARAYHLLTYHCYADNTQLFLSTAWIYRAFLPVSLKSLFGWGKKLSLSLSPASLQPDLYRATASIWDLQRLSPQSLLEISFSNYKFETLWGYVVWKLHLTNYLWCLIGNIS